MQAIGSASVTDVMTTSPDNEAIQSTTRASGDRRKISEMTFVSRMVTPSPPPARHHHAPGSAVLLPC